MNTHAGRRIGAAAAVLVLGAGLSACAGDPLPPGAGGGPGTGAGPDGPGTPTSPPVAESTLYGDGVTGSAYIESYEGETVGVSGDGELVQGDDWNGRLVVTERSAIALAATSADEDMVIEIEGNGVDGRWDDRSQILDLFTTSTNALDSAAVTVLEAGVYDITFSEFGDDATPMSFELLSGTASMQRLGSTSVDLAADTPSLAIVDVDSGPALISADSPEVDPVLHVVDAAESHWSNDDNEIGLSNWRAAAVEADHLEGPAVAIVESWAGDAGFVSLVVT